MFTKIKKRDGRVADFDSSKISDAIAKAGQATGEFDDREAKKLTLKVLTLARDLRLGTCPDVEEIQDIVERILLDSPFYKTAKSYIIYREQHKQIRKITIREHVELMDSYIRKMDWKVKENSNMSYSLQGLNNYISSDITAEYWLNCIYPPEVREAHNRADLHIHDLSLLSVYCVGWDLQDLLMEGFKGVAGKVESSPPRHFRTALGQMVNFFYTLQGEAAGAQAMSNFDTLLAPFVRADGLGYKEVKQALQEFVFNINIPTRVGFQCLSEDTDILTPDGWMCHIDIEVGQIIKTFNIKTGVVEDLPVQKIFSKPYSGEMYRLKNRIQDQLISPGHRVVRKKFNTDESFIIEEIEKIIEYKSPVIIPITGKNTKENKNISDDEIRLLAWIIAEGTKESYASHRHCNRIAIYQSKSQNPENYDEIIGILNRMGFTYSNRDSTPALGTSSQMLRLNAASSQQILDTLFKTRETVKFIPDILKNMSKNQARLFFETYLKADGHEGCKITTTDIEILNGLQHIAVDAEYGFTVGTRKPTIGKKMLHILRLIDHQDTYIQTIEKVDYSGVIWCPTTDNETVIARRNGKVFITGNTPFTNITMDLIVPLILKDSPVIIGGQYREETYSSFQKEMDLINRAFAEVMMEGDAKGRVFTFPIPTYNITENFDWNNPNLESIWKMTGKYGIPYFSNFVNSDMSPDDARSMCPLHPDTKVIVMAGRGMTIRTIKDVYYTSQQKGTQYKILCNGKWHTTELVADHTEGCLELSLGNGQKVSMDVRHEQPVKQAKGEPIKIITAANIEIGMYIPFNAVPIEEKMENYDAGFAVGAFIGDGSYDGRGSLVYSLNSGEKEDNVAKKIRKFYESIGFKVSSSNEKHNVVFHLVRGSNKSAEKWMVQFVSGRSAHEKRITNWSFQLGANFLQGILDGWYATDGGNKGRIYTVNIDLAEDFEVLCGLLGKAYTIDKKGDNREGRLGNNPVYTLKFHTRECYGDFYFYEDGYWWYPVNNIRKMIEFDSMVFCFTVNSEEHLFQLANGMITHNCRLRLDNRQLQKRGGGLFGANPLTGSIGVVTINMPRIGYLADSEKNFIKRLDDLIKIAADSLVIKRKVLEKFTNGNLYPYSKFYLRKIKEHSDCYWRNHFSTIGILGMHEACINFIGEGIGSDNGQAFAVKVMDHIRHNMEKIQEQTGEMFNLEATPGEGTTYRFAMMDKQRYPEILCANETEYKNGKAPFYTNSTHLPVNYTDDIFEALELQDQLQTRYTGGTVLHLFLGEQVCDSEIVKNMVKKVAINYKLPYFTITPTFSVCPSHGYISGEMENCPKCGEETEVYSRVVGYLRPVKQWNNGKQTEFCMRKTFKVAS